MPAVASIHYASPPPDYFWKWSPQHTAAEWHDGQTIALWMELEILLGFLEQDGGLPPLGAVMLLLAACREDWPVKSLCLEEWLTVVSGDQGEVERSALLGGLYAALRSVHRLPKDLRASLRAKFLLASAVFENPVSRLAQSASGAILDDLRVGGPRAFVGLVPDLDSKARFLRDSKAVLTGLAAHDEHTLEARLRTGLEQTDLVGAGLPDEIRPLETGRLLLDELASQGGEAAAAATVAKRAIAMINFPGRFNTPDNLPVGGISDITNRGSLDRLLPGELVWDDLVLAARLVHQEALYFRREVPPADVPVRLVVVLDRGLRLWGHLRVLSLGVALGLVHHPALVQDGTPDASAATTTGTETINLLTPEGVHAALEALVPSATPMAALTELLETARILEAPEDLVFITAREHLNDPPQRVILGELAAALEARGGSLRVITLERGGELEIQSWSTAGNRTLFRGVFSTEELIPARGSRFPATLRSVTPDQPVRAARFLFPLVPQRQTFLRNPATGGGVGILKDGRLMRWPRPRWGAEELAEGIPGRERWLAREEDGGLIVIASADAAGGAVRVFRVDDKGLSRVSIEKSTHAFPRFATVAGGAVLVGYNHQIEAFSLETGHRVGERTLKRFPNNPVLTFDGETIGVHESEGREDFFTQEWSDPPDRLPENPADASVNTGVSADPIIASVAFGKRKDSLASPASTLSLRQPLLPGMSLQHIPKSITLADGVLRVKTESKLLRFDLEDLSWIEEKPGRALGPLVAFTPKGTQFDTTLEASFGPAWMATVTDRGVLSLKPVGPSGKSWQLLLFEPSSSLLHPDWGLLSHEPTLRWPGSPAPASQAIAAFETFLKSIWNEFRSA